MDRFLELRAFVAVTEACGFSAAARETGNSRSALNRLVLALEERLGVQLLNRSTRQISPTSAGRAFYERARQILDDLDEAETAVSAIHEEAIGRLRISAPLSYGQMDFSEIVTQFMMRHPRVEVDLQLETRFVDPVAEGFDLIVRIGEPDEETTLVDHRIITLDYATCAAPSYLEKAGTPQHPHDLKEHKLLVYVGGSRSKVWPYTGPEGEVHIAVDGVLNSNNMEPLGEAALAGLGIATLPVYAVRDHFDTGALVKVMTDYKLPPRMLQVIYPPTRHLSAKVRLFTEFIDEHCSDAPL
ncbi:MAG: LysR substrate-binding domain-containing protein [Filomicrobium sp.]